jgi:DNA-binding transcriptional LysR family regulator
LELLREEPLVWVASERFRVEDGAPIPLALSSLACLWRRATEEALAKAPRATTRGLFFSKNYSAIGSVVRAGLAVTTLPASMVGEGMRVLGEPDGLPELPMTRMGIIHAPGRGTEEARALAEAIRLTVAAPVRRAA